MGVKDKRFCTRVCNCSDCSFLKCVREKDGDVFTGGFLYECGASSASFPYGLGCTHNDGKDNGVRMFKIEAEIDNENHKDVKEPFYVFGVSREVAAKRFIRAMCLLDIRNIEQCTESESIRIMQSNHIQII